MESEWGAEVAGAEPGGQGPIEPAVRAAAGSAAAAAGPGGDDDGVPPLLRRERSQRYHAQFLRQHEPLGPTEVAIVGDLARQAAAMELWAEAVGAVGRRAARAWPDFALAETESPDVRLDSVLAAVMSAEGVDRCQRHALGASRAFHRALNRLDEVQRARRNIQSQGPLLPPPPFAGEAACEAYLAERFRGGKYRCRRCGGAEGCLVAARKCWECRGCKTQIGLRAGTVMARSRVPLRTWFEAIRWLLWQPTIATGDLAAKLGVRRPATVRTMARRIRAAMAEEEASQLLAGLDAHYARCQGGGA